MNSGTGTPVNLARFTSPSQANIDDSVETDILVREGWAQFREVFGNHALKALTKYGLLMVKPDGMVAGTLFPVRRFLESCGFKIIGARQVRLNRAIIRLLWHSDWLQYSADRLAFSDYLYTSGPAALLLLEDVSNADAPCINRLAQLKGPARLDDRSHGDMRSALGSPNRVINFVHTPDSCIDILRELPVLLDAEELADFLQRRNDNDLERFLSKIDLDAGRHEFALQQSLVRAGLQNILGPDIAQGRKLPFHEILRIVGKAAPNCLPWDLVTIALHSIELDRAQEQENSISSFEIACTASSVRVPLEFETGARQSYADLRRIRANIPVPDMHDEPASIFRALGSLGNESRPD